MPGKQQKLQKPPPKGIDPKTSKPYEPVKREQWDKLLRRAASPEPQGKNARGRI